MAFTKDQKKALMGAEITLNGNPASITGAAMPFATIVDMTTGLHAQWAWATVAKVVAAGGAFVS